MGERKRSSQRAAQYGRALQAMEANKYDERVKRCNRYWRQNLATHGISTGY